MKALERCRGCDGSVWWAITERKHSWIPLNPDPSADGTFELTGKRTETHRGWMPVVAYTTTGTADRYTSHHSTCPGAKHFSKRRVRKAADRAIDRARRF